MHSKLFTDSELKEIEDAVELIEGNFAVELVPVFSTISDDYPIAKYRAALIGFLSAFVLLLGLNFWISFALLPFYIQGMLWVIWVLFFISLEEFIPQFRRFLIGEELLHQKSYEAAKMEFFKNDVYINPHRIGILLYLSFFERKFHILSDKRSVEFIDQMEWQEIAEKFGKDLRHDKPAHAIAKCIHNLGEALKDKAINPETIEPSILPNTLKINE